MTKEGDEILYHERLASPGRVFIFGGGHVSQALVPVLAGIDFSCVVVDDRPEFARTDLFPQAVAVRESIIKNCRKTLASPPMITSAS